MFQCFLLICYPYILLRFNVFFILVHNVFFFYSCIYTYISPLQPVTHICIVSKPVAQLAKCECREIPTGKRRCHNKQTLSIEH